MKKEKQSLNFTISSMTKANLLHHIVQCPERHHICQMYVYPLLWKFFFHSPKIVLIKPKGDRGQGDTIPFLELRSSALLQETEEASGNHHLSNSLVRTVWSLEQQH